MSKRCICVIVLIYCCPVDNNAFGERFYEFLQKGVGFLIDRLVPDFDKEELIQSGGNIKQNPFIEDKGHNHNNENIIDNELEENSMGNINNNEDNSNNILNKEQVSQEQKLNQKIDFEEFKKDFNAVENDQKKWIKLIELHYVWCAFYGTALVQINKELIGGLEEDVKKRYEDIEKITLDASKIADFFLEKNLKCTSTLEVLKKVFEFSQFEENFIKNNTSFKDFISSNLSSFFKEDGYVCEMISSLQKNVNSDDAKKALWWIFTIALGVYYQIEMGNMVHEKLNIGFWNKSDNSVKNSAKYIVDSFLQRVILFQRFIAYFKLLYKICNNAVNEIFIDCVNKHMSEVLQGLIYLDSFENLMYRNKDERGSSINLVGNITSI